jgi:hypothetical protein
LPKVTERQHSFVEPDNDLPYLRHFALRTDARHARCLRSPRQEGYRQCDDPSESRNHNQSSSSVVLAVKAVQLLLYCGQRAVFPGHLSRLWIAQSPAKPRQSDFEKWPKATTKSFHQ